MSEWLKKNKHLFSEDANPHMYQDHPLPVTRRDFLRQGFITFSAATVLGDLGSFFTQKAMAEGCGTTMDTKEFIPFLVFDCVGGAGLPANFLVGKGGNPDENMLASYDRLGWDPKESGGLEKSYGLPMSAKMSKILQGIQTVASADARARLRMGSFCHFAQDDTSSNPLSAISLVADIGYRGKIVSRGLGTQNSDSGGGSRAALGKPSRKPIFVSSLNDVQNSVGLGTAYPFDRLTKEDVGMVMETNRQINDEQIKAFSGSPKSQAFKELVSCAAEENARLLQNTAAIDPRVVTNFQQLYQINANTQPNARPAVAATIVMNTLTGNTGPGVLSIGGCDYHNSTQATGDAKDLEIGTEIGRAIEAAHRLKKPLFFQILTDGGVSNRAGTRIWVSDAGDKCMTVIGYYLPTEAPKQRRIQVGRFTDGQGADRSTVIGANPSKVGCAVFANYLKLSVADADFEKEFEKYVPKGTFANSAELESMLIFG